MTEYAILRLEEAHHNLPDEIEEWNAGWEYIVVPWRCPVCDQVIAQTVGAEGKPKDRGMVRTVMVDFSPVHDVEADQDGIPFFRPSRRRMRGKQERRQPKRLGQESDSRALTSKTYRSGASLPPRDHDPIEAWTFDSVCDNCPRRLRFVIPSL